MDNFKSSELLATEILTKAKLVAKGKTITEAGIDASWMAAYGCVARRCDEDRRYGITRYPYEAGPAVAAFVGGFFDHREWPLRRGLLGQSSMRAVAEYEAKYVNATGYWAAFHQSAITLRTESIEENKPEDARRFDVWAIIAVRYALRVLGLRCEFYEMAAEDPVQAKMVLPSLERRGKMIAADDMEEPLHQLETHMVSQLMKAVATLSASNATKKNGGGGAKGGGAS